MTSFRVESAMRMEFRPLGDAVAVFNDDLRVATIQGGFVEFWNKAELSIDEVALIVKRARDDQERQERERARRHREHLAAYDGVREAVRLLCACEQVPVPSNVTVVIDGMHCNVPMTERDA